MKRQKIQFAKNLDIIRYMITVQQISDEFFDDHGDFQPQVGNLNAMRVFYNTCVVGENPDMKQITDAMDMEDLIIDKEFVNAFNSAITFDYGASKKFDFANAYADAMDIVEYKKNSLTAAVDKIKEAIYSILEYITPALSSENLASVAKIAEDIKNGKVSAESIIDAYSNSARFNEVINSNTQN